MHALETSRMHAQGPRAPLECHSAHKIIYLLEIL